MGAEPQRRGPRLADAVLAGDPMSATPLVPEVTREEILTALGELQKAHADLRRRLDGLERRVARQERRAAADARGGAR